ncbi:bifunctional nicotinamidase/pyrazinamidase [Negadavirga shengliensis]|uniref:nicotinamidase n=1 Tax=Negadavirga shengliensis TaxID=1389218 RepID=A0ABV9SZF3_9BACT
MKALIIVDVQNDFLPGGALEVREGDSIIPVINALQKKFDLIVATQDWHPANHRSFAANNKGRQVGEIIDLAGIEQVLWPVHCVENTEGAAFHKNLDREKWARIFQKGTNPVVDSYSGFFDNNRMGETGLGKYLKKKGVEKVFIAGLATDYCVKFTVMDALSLGFKTYLIEDATRGVNLSPTDTERSVTEMRKAGAKITHSGKIL